MGLFKFICKSLHFNCWSCTEGSFLELGQSNTPISLGCLETIVLIFNKKHIHFILALTVVYAILKLKSYQQSHIKTKNGYFCRWESMGTVKKTKMICWVCVLCLFTLIVVEILFVLCISFSVRKLKINLKHSTDANITFWLDLKKNCNLNSMMYSLLFSHIPYFCKYKHHYIYEGMYICQLWLANILIYKIINIACLILTSKLAKGVKAKTNTGTLEHSAFK